MSYDSKLPKRLRLLDFSRGIAALAVVLWHWQHFWFGCSYRKLEGFERSKQPLYSIFSIFYEKGDLAVPFFFVLSGFVFFWLYGKSIAVRSCTVRQFAVTRLARLYPLHLATLLIVAALQSLYFAYAQHYFVYPLNNLKYFGLHLLFASHWGLESGHSFNAPIWSVSIEIGLYALFFIVAFIRRATWPYAILIVAAAIILQFIGFDSLWLPAIEAFFIGGLLYYFIEWHCSRKLRVVEYLVIGSLAFLCCYCLLFDCSAMFGPSRLCQRLLYPLMVATLVMVELRYENIGTKVAWVGDITYSVYLIHFPLQIVFILVSDALGFNRDIFYSHYVLLPFFGILIPLSLLTFYFFERPAQHALRRFATPRSAKPTTTSP